ncbi:MAG TPA: adenosylmethionine--8-amino-7-oxononanoate transaminase [Spirochaetia bacterium]|nr:MAG: adenosylmethionine--8-amino-7-oxononanoate transaminase [Spirochaetes bacterium GWB1_36_13]HCL57194.1 adenosylmethionine--8-amino-7-oxononanoate transaminase [Spirochaetia bacterium]
MKKNKVLSIDKKHIWHPFTQMKDYETIDPKVIVKGKGVKLYDIDGNEYYDTISSWWTNLLGHQNKKLNQALKKQIKKLEHVNFSGFTHPYAAGLVEQLSKKLPPSLSRFFFSDNGSTAVEVALKTAFQYFQNQGNREKKTFIRLKNSYHGDTMGAVSVGGVDLYHKLYHPLMFETLQADSPDCSNCPKRKSEFTYEARETGCALECFASMEKLLEEKSSEIIAVIIEPIIQAAGGMIVYPFEYLKKLRKLTLEKNVLLIFDEVATGFGRTGSFFAFEKAGVVPDLLCLSKGITGGYMPLAMTVSTEKIYQAFYDDYFSNKTFYHGHSYTANPLACSLAVETLKILEEENLPESQKDTIEFFHNTLKEFGKEKFIADIRFTGFIGAVDVVEDRKSKKSFLPEKRMGQKIYLKSLENGLVLRPLGDTIYWFLPLVIKKKDIKIILEKSLKVIAEAVRE